MNETCRIPPGSPTPDELARILSGIKVIALIGASPNPERPSHSVMAYLQEAGFRVIPVNPGQSEVRGEKCYPSLADIPVPVDTADIFLNSTRVPPVVDQAIAKGVRTVWMQLGVVHEEAAEKARAAGLTVVMNRCLKIDHAAWTARGADRIRGEVA
jgi:predicted CoA-binding protein